MYYRAHDFTTLTLLRSNKMKGKHPKKEEKKMPKKPGKNC